nr:MAG TPA: Head Tail Connector Protein [Caudoviricetes sp.]
MQGVDFAYYRDSYCGRAIVTEEEFNSFAVRACAYVNKITFGRAEATADTAGVKNAVCAVCEVLHRYDAREGISSENNDGYSVTYKTSSRQVQDRLYEAASLHLSSALLYRGLDA